jgi:hypothetical protein
MNKIKKLRDLAYGRYNCTFLFIFLFWIIIYNPSAAQTITGQYSNTHIISYLDIDGWVETEVSDTLVLTELQDDSLHFEFYLVHTNGHTCWMDGIAAKIDSVYEYKEIFDEEYESGECKLHIIITNSEIILKDIDGGCRFWYCGMRGYINGITFNRN